MTENEHLDFEDGFNGISRFTCYKPSYLVEEWENGKIIREWDIMRMKEDYFAFLVHLNELSKENKELRELVEYKNETQKEALEKMVKAQRENQTIKNTIIEAYNTERTHIGSNVLRQLIEALEI